MDRGQGREYLARLIYQALRRHFLSEREALLYSIAQTVLQEFRNSGVGCHRRPATTFDDPRRGIREGRERR